METFNFLPEGWNTETINIKDTNEINQYIQNGQVLQGIVQECDDTYNLHINLGTGLLGIVPRAEVEGINLEQDGIPKKNLCVGKVHKYIQFKAKEITKDNNIILSRKDVQKEALEQAIYNLNEGDTVRGIVKNITSYGAFIEIGGGVVGLAHIEDLSVARIKSPFERLKIGQKVNIVVKSIDRTSNKISLSYKESFGTWIENANKFKVGDKVEGIIRETEKNKNGIFIELTPNLVGMIEYKNGLIYGKKINVLIKKIDYEKQKIKLSVVNKFEGV